MTDRSTTYESAGVSISAGNELVRRIKPIVARTARSGTSASIGGFGGTFDLHAAGYDGGPILVSAIDGIGTKVKIAFALNMPDSVGIDLVAMNVNDVLVQGARPLYFLDYYACGKLDVKQAERFVLGVTQGCIMADTALIGGETAEMPGMYVRGEFEAAGCATGAIGHGAPVLPDTQNMQIGDCILGLASSGLHANGFALARKIIENAKLRYTDPAPWINELAAITTTLTSVPSIGESLLTPTRIYVKSVLPVIEERLVKGMAHITGGGMVENIPRILPKHLSARIDVSTYPVPAVQRWLKSRGNVSAHEFARVWNTGIGFCLIVDATNVQRVTELLQQRGERVYTMGQLVQRDADVESTLTCGSDGSGTTSTVGSPPNSIVKEIGAPGCILTNVHVWNE